MAYIRIIWSVPVDHLQISPILSSGVVLIPSCRCRRLGITTITRLFGVGAVLALIIGFSAVGATLSWERRSPQRLVARFVGINVLLPYRGITFFGILEVLLTGDGAYTFAENGVSKKFFHGWAKWSKEVERSMGYHEGENE